MKKTIHTILIILAFKISPTYVFSQVNWTVDEIKFIDSNEVVFSLKCSIEEKNYLSITSSSQPGTDYPPILEAINMERPKIKLDKKEGKIIIVGRNLCAIEERAIFKVSIKLKDIIQKATIMLKLDYYTIESENNIFKNQICLKIPNPSASKRSIHVGYDIKEYPKERVYRMY